MALGVLAFGWVREGLGHVRLGSGCFGRFGCSYKVGLGGPSDGLDRMLLLFGVVFGLGWACFGWTWDGFRSVWDRLRVSVWERDGGCLFDGRSERSCVTGSEWLLGWLGRFVPQ